MVNYIWAFFIIVGILYSFLVGNTDIINTEIISSASSSINMILTILPIMCLWLGLMNIAKESGMLDVMSKKISPAIKILFPEIPKNHESLSLISSNIVMNMLGLGNAATPFGLKAMKSMQSLNKHKDRASRSMITFLVINTASVTIIPTTVISFRLINGARNPSDIVLASVITTILSCLFGLLLDRICYLIWRRKHVYS